ncbi:hypothetical protein Poli38472_005966 [Pythium oligandrum]|uniref:Uncharacterized protein n=1 Tax=Pythium oligandrum TaxID=41045 RepID=A0A8K1CUI4_PYTOL|nr:hypothetical protein Poli38472_005966 [Pythium oligandrum]|eukprot:TMW68498.1 hypothetical protein Poli38472_005966 [Pythium oligandrum]
MGPLSEPTPPKLPTFTTKTSIKTRLQAIQNYLNALEYALRMVKQTTLLLFTCSLRDFDRYNYTGTLYFDVNKNRSFKSIVSTAKDIVSEMLPIQCLEAVFLAAYLTSNVADLERFPISFKTEAGSSVHRHIILAVRHQNNKWGALGLSRSEKLMYKELRFNSMSELVQEYCRCFESVCHSVIKLYIGFPFPHDIHSSEKVEWRALNLSMTENPWTDIASHLDAFAKEAADILSFKRAKGTLPSSFLSKFPLHTPEAEHGKKSPEKRKQLSANSLDFPPVMLCDEDETASPPPAAITPSPEKDDTKKPILVAPDQLVFKRAVANQAHMLPTNIFLQNTTTSAFSIEVEDPSGQLEVVTKATAPPAKSQQEETAKSDAPVKPTFRVSARGMIVIAVRCKQPTETPATACSDSSAQSTQRKTTGELKRTKTPRGGTQKAAEALVPDQNALRFTCYRLLKSTEAEQSNEAESTETYTTALPFIITA